MKKLLLLFLSCFSFSFYGQIDTLSIIKHTDDDFVVPKESKLVYRGLQNRISIKVPNAKSFSVKEKEGLLKITNELYNINPGMGREYTITIDIVLKNNKITTENHTFRIRNLSNLEGYINNKKASQNPYINKNEIKGAIIGLKSFDLNLDFNIRVKHFIIQLPDNKKIEVFGNKITEETFNKIRVRRGDQLMIYDFHFDYLKDSPQALFCKIPAMILIIK